MKAIVIPGASGIATLAAAVTLMAFSAPDGSAEHARHAPISTVSYLNR